MSAQLTGLVLVIHNIGHAVLNNMISGNECG